MKVLDNCCKNIFDYTKVDRLSGCFIYSEIVFVMISVFSHLGASFEITYSNKTSISVQDLM